MGNLRGWGRGLAAAVLLGALSLSGTPAQAAPGAMPVPATARAAWVARAARAAPAAPVASDCLVSPMELAETAPSGV